MARQQWLAKVSDHSLSHRFPLESLFAGDANMGPSACKGLVLQPPTPWRERRGRLISQASVCLLLLFSSPWGLCDLHKRSRVHAHACALSLMLRLSCLWASSSLNRSICCSPLLSLREALVLLQRCSSPDSQRRTCRRARSLSPYSDLRVPKYLYKSRNNTAPQVGRTPHLSLPLLPPTPPRPFQQCRGPEKPSGCLTALGMMQEEFPYHDILELFLN